MSPSATSTVTLTIDGQPVTTGAEHTILEAARSVGVHIPTLCWDPKTKPFGGCRVCLVTVTGTDRPVAACTTPCADGMAVDTAGARNLVRDVLNLQMSDHPENCTTCAASGHTELHDLADRFGAAASDSQNPFAGARRTQPDETENPFIIRDFGACIQCGKCIRICDEARGVVAIGWKDGGFGLKVAAPFDDVLDCEFCGHCVDVCPTGSLREKMAEGAPVPDRTVTTICGYCGVGCGMHVQLAGDQVVRVTPEHGNPCNDGALCVKGKFGYDFVNHPDRLGSTPQKGDRVTGPLVRRNGKLQPAEWEEALDLVAERLLAIKAAHGPHAIAGMPSAKCTNEENYLFQKMLRGGLVTNHIDHCTRLCHAASTKGLIMSFGTGAMTNSTDDFEAADVVFAAGTNTIENHPVSALKLKKAIRNGTKLIVADPRRIEMVEWAHIWLDLQPGTNAALFTGMLHVIVEEDLLDHDFIAARTEGFEAAIETARRYNPEFVSTITGVAPNKIVDAARLYGRARAAAIFNGMGITQHSSGTDNMLCLTNLALATGNVGRAGTGVNPLRGQNNVQGSCDMAGIPTELPGYHLIADPAVREKFSTAWNAPVPDWIGKTLVEITDAAYEGEIKAIYVLGENPVLSDPDVNKTTEALKRLDFLVVQDIFLTETAELADVVLPGASFLEKDGTFTNTDRRVQRVRTALPRPAGARDDLHTIMEISNRIGLPMHYSGPEAVWDEIRTLWPHVAGMRYDRLEAGHGLQWPCPTEDHPGTPFLYAETFPIGKGKFHPVEFVPPRELPDDEYPYMLTTGRWLLHYHTGSMTRRSRGIDTALPEGFVEIHPDDAEALDVVHDQMVRVTSRRGTIQVRALVSNRSRKGVVFIPFHFAEAAANALTNTALDEKCKIPELKVCAVHIAPL
ncbi:MAG: formate dehydrogenase subunit alpha [Nitrospirota bacterium]|nr:formate dehydrogenase subunit alpha [Nitrospirota bacterium]